MQVISSAPMIITTNSAVVKTRVKTVRTHEPELEGENTYSRRLAIASPNVVTKIKIQLLKDLVVQNSL